MAVTIFISYAHEDEALLDRLLAHLKSLERDGSIVVWSERNIRAGTEKEHEIIEQLNTAQIILLLVSSNFLNSDYCYATIMPRALERHERRDAKVIPIILSPVYLKNAPFDKLQVLPTYAKPVSSWNNLDEAFSNVTEGIRSAITALLPPLSTPQNQYYASSVSPDMRVHLPNTMPSAPLQPAPRHFSSHLNTVIAGLILLFILVSGGLIYFTTVFLPNQLHTQATATAFAQATSTVFANTPQNIYNQVTKRTPVLDDPLSGKDNNNWNTSHYTDGGCQFIGETYQASGTQPESDNFCEEDAHNFSNFIFQLQMQILKGDCGGFVFRATDVGANFYFFEVCQDGSYSVLAYKNDKSQYFRQSKKNSAILVGYRQHNLIAVMANGNALDFFVNTKFVDSVNDSTFSSGVIGVIAKAHNNPPTVVAFSNAKVWSF